MLGAVLKKTVVERTYGHHNIHGTHTHAMCTAPLDNATGYCRVGINFGQQKP